MSKTFFDRELPAITPGEWDRALAKLRPKPVTFTVAGEWCTRERCETCDNEECRIMAELEQQRQARE